MSRRILIAAAVAMCLGVGLMPATSQGASQTLGKGAQRTAPQRVAELHDQFRALGYPLGRDARRGVYGVRTEGAVKYFQRANDLRVTGRVNPRTARLLRQEVVRLQAAEVGDAPATAPRPASPYSWIGEHAVELAVLAAAIALALLAAAPRPRLLAQGLLAAAALAALAALAWWYPGAAVIAACALLVAGCARWTLRSARRAKAAKPVSVSSLPTRPAVWVCVPTYNEAALVQPMIRSLLGVFDANDIDGHVLVIDDASPDGTGALADAISAEDKRVQVLHRAAKAGLGRAYIAGFRRALAGGADLVVEMDCDFSHDPQALPGLLDEAKDSHLVLGSRYVQGGGVVDWPLQRRIISRGGSWYARTVLGVEVRDLTGGFKCFRREVLEALPFHAIGAAGYGFQVEVTYRVLADGFSVAETPITFRDRTLGESKMSSSIAFEAALAVLKLRWGSGTTAPPRPAPAPKPAKPATATAPKSLAPATVAATVVAEPAELA